MALRSGSGLHRDEVGLRADGVPVGFMFLFLGYLILGLGSQNHKVGYPTKGVWYEPTGRTLTLKASVDWWEPLCGLYAPLVGQRLQTSHCSMCARKIKSNMVRRVSLGHVEKGACLTASKANRSFCGLRGRCGVRLLAAWLSAQSFTGS